MQPYQPYGGQYVQYQQPMVAQNPPQNTSNPQAAQKKRKKKKNTAPAQGLAMVANAPVQQQMVQAATPNAPQVHSADFVSSSATAQAMPIAPAGLSVADGATTETGPPKSQKNVRCWKCAMNTHATKDCKVTHYCLVCDADRHPTVRCPILKLPKPQGYFVGCGDFDTLDVHLPDSAYKPHLIPTGVPTALV
jgi:hypothetical protein